MDGAYCTLNGIYCLFAGKQETRNLRQLCKLLRLFLDLEMGVKIASQLRITVPHHFLEPVDKYRLVVRYCVKSRFSEDFSP